MGNSLVATMNQPEQTVPDTFVVVVNGEDQHALWQAGLDVPSGWRSRSAVMSSRRRAWPPSPAPGRT